MLSKRLAATLLLCASTAMAGVNTWTTNGPPGGASSVAIDPSNPSVFYGVNFHGFWRSLDGGGSWQTIFLPPLANEYPYSVAAGPAYTVYVGTCCFSVDLFKGLGAGVSWTHLSYLDGLCSGSQIVTDPVAPNVIYAVVSPCYGGAPNRTSRGDLAKSLDGGLTFFWSSGGLAGLDYEGVSAFAIDPAHHETLYAATSAGLFRSTDGGSTWSLLNILDFLKGPKALGTIVVDPSNPSTIYASVTEVIAPLTGGVLKSIDGGRTFREVSTGLPSLLPASGLVIDPRQPNRLYVAISGVNGQFNQKAAVFATDNGGDFWTPMSDGLPDLESPGGAPLEEFPLVIDPEGKFLLAATPGGVFDYEFQDLRPVTVPQTPREPREVAPRH